MFNAKIYIIFENSKYMANNIINKIQISGQSYDVKDSSAATVVELTQQEYDNLPSSAKTSNTLFVITDAEAGDLTNYYTKTETNTLLGGKQATLVSGTNIKTINNESLLGSGNIDVQGGGGSVTVDPSLDSGSTNAVANSAITTAFKNTDYVTTSFSSEDLDLVKKDPFDTSYRTVVAFGKINGSAIASPNSSSRPSFSLIETSAITTSVTSSSTDSQLPSAKAVYDIIGDIETLLSQI